MNVWNNYVLPWIAQGYQVSWHPEFGELAVQGFFSTVDPAGQPVEAVMLNLGRERAIANLLWSGRPGQPHLEPLVVLARHVDDAIRTDRFWSKCPDAAMHVG
jgi:hypothetical protein